ncbi:MAG: bifunctional hydroxymethylpyrimidine kinase/phosphomethylpyrimidine kinase [Acidobacteria bacterium]|nr:bifunctional hydroxymethylpyrimidine kinase/phosphomethylpyrimidine kinase [Acidobacteriota bacterium]
MTPVALTIAGSDPSGGAGLQADLKTFHQFGCYGMAVVSLLTVQNTVSVDAVELVSPELVRRQLEAVTTDILPGAAKTGALGSAAIIGVVADWARQSGVPLVVDPVMISKHGASLLAEEARQALLDQLLPRCTLLTPNAPEAARLTGLAVEDRDGMRAAAVRLRTLGAPAVLLKGGHLPGPEAVDLLLDEGGEVWLSAPRVDSKHTHGTGCVTAAAIAAGLAQGLSLEVSVRRAKAFVAAAIREAPGLGAGHGPLHLFAGFPDA